MITQFSTYIWALLMDSNTHEPISTTFSLYQIAKLCVILCQRLLIKDPPVLSLIKKSVGSITLFPLHFAWMHNSRILPTVSICLGAKYLVAIDLLITEHSDKPSPIHLRNLNHLEVMVPFYHIVWNLWALHTQEKTDRICNIWQLL